jgi:hypothetical protein
MQLDYERYRMKPDDVWWYRRLVHVVCSES